MLAFLLVLLCQPSPTRAAGLGLHTLVVANAASTNSLDLANAYCQGRQVPPQNLVRVRWSGSRTAWSPVDFRNSLLTPVLQTVAERGLSNQIDFVVLSMDLPYRITNGSDQNSTTSALFYGLKTNDPATAGQVCRFAMNAINPFYGSETRFRDGGPRPAEGQAFLATMLTADTLPLARQYAQRALLADATFPTNRIILAKTSDPARNVRYEIFDNTVFDLRILKGPPAQHILLDALTSLTAVGGLQTGLARFTANPATFIPGSLADSLTSFGGMLFESSGQTNLLAFLTAGAAGSYGTVAEPCNYLEKFPDPLAFLYQARGFSLAESYYQSLIAPYQGVIVGDPLCAPFRRAATGAWTQPDPMPVLQGTTNLTLRLAAADASHPLERVDLFIDGRWAQTLTYAGPAPGNILRVAIAGQPLDYTVPTGATLWSITTNLGNLLMEESYHQLTHVDAYSYGDRLELQSLPSDRSGVETSLSVSTEPGSAEELTLFAQAANPSFLDTVAHGWRRFTFEGTVTSNDVATLTVLKVDGSTVSVSVTNTPPAASLLAFGQRLAQAINQNAQLTGPDGLLMQDILAGENAIEFGLAARAEGRAGSGIQAIWELPATLEAKPGPTATLEQRPNDLHPRNHLYLAAGKTNLELNISLDTTAWADGYHELQAVAYEGTSMATATAFPCIVRIQNQGASARLLRTDEGGSLAIGNLAHLQVVPEQGTVSSVQIFTTGGLYTELPGSAPLALALDGATLGAGQHEVAAVVNFSDGHAYRTEPVRVVFFRHPPLRVDWSASTRELLWNAEPSFSYDVFSATNAAGPYLWRETLLSTNQSTLRWLDPQLPPSNAPSQQFYRVGGRP